MITRPLSLSPHTNEATETSNGWKELLPLLHPTIINAPREGQAAWAKLDRRIVAYRTHQVATFPWLNHLALAGWILTESGLVRPRQPLEGLHKFLRWAIPSRYPTVASLEPTEALVAYFGDPPRARGNAAHRSYSSLQLHMHSYLKSLPPEQRQTFDPFLFPTLVNTPHLSKLNAYTTKKAQTKRKEQAFAVVRDLHWLVAMGWRRHKWLAELDTQVQQVTESVKEGHATLPAMIQCQGLDQQELIFRLWDRRSWVTAHRQGYSRGTLQHKARADQVFLQLVGSMPEAPWFLRAVEVGAFGAVLSSPAREYLRTCNVPAGGYSGNGLLTMDYGTTQFLKYAQGVTAGTLADSQVLFCVEPLLAAAALGLFALICLTQSGMRMGELQQISGDQNCMKIGFSPQFSEKTGAFADPPARLLFWQLYPKGSTERQPYPVTPYMQEALKVWMETHHRFCGIFQDVGPVPYGFTHSRRFSRKQKFVLQWKGKHLPAAAIERCLDFLLLEHLCLESNGKSTRITAHVLRHGLAGYLRKQGIPLEEIAGLLKQINVRVTEYYSRLSPEDLHAKLAPLLTRLGDIVEIDPATIRTAGDILNLEREALKRYGILRHTPGGTCSTFVPCDVQYGCASCPHYIPDPARRNEVKEKIVSHTQAIRLFGEGGDYLQAEVQKTHRRNWERVEKEMNALAAIELASPALESVLKEFGLNNLAEVDETWLLTLKQLPALLGEATNANA